MSVNFVDFSIVKNLGECFCNSKAKLAAKLALFRLITTNAHDPGDRELFVTKFLFTS
jgi:hypothetical protein